MKENKSHLSPTPLIRLFRDERIPFHFVPDTVPPAPVEYRRQEYLPRMTVTDEGPADPEHEADNQDVSRGEMRELKNMIDKCAVNLMVNMLSSTEYDVDLSIARTA